MTTGRFRTFFSRRAARAATCGLLMATAGCIAVAGAAIPIGGGLPRGGGGGVAASPATATARVAELVNRHRVSAGCPALVWSDAAARAAQRHSDDMARNGILTHRGSDGSQVGDRVRAAGVEWRAVAENVAQTGGGADDAVRLWLRSAGHRTNIENCTYTHQGVGVRGDYWTHVFFTPLRG